MGERERKGCSPPLLEICRSRRRCSGVTVVEERERERRVLPLLGIRREPLLGRGRGAGEKRRGTVGERER